VGPHFAGCIIVSKPFSYKSCAAQSETRLLSVQSEGLLAHEPEGWHSTTSLSCWCTAAV